MESIHVEGRDGLHGTADESIRMAAPQSEVRVSLADGRQIGIPRDLLQERADGTFTLPLSYRDLPGGSQQEDLVVPVVEEELTIGRRTVTTGTVRIKKTVQEREEVISEPLLQEHVQIKRVAMNQVVDGPLPVRYMGDVMVIPLIEEVLKIEKQFVLTEELHVTKTRETVQQEQRVTLRREEAHLERVDASGRVLSTEADAPVTAPSASLPAPPVPTPAPAVEMPRTTIRRNRIIVEE